MLVDYDDIIKNQFNGGVIEKVTSPPLVGNTTYLPHRSVIREDKACVTPLLFDVLLCFQAHDIALTADIAKAYLQISVTESERDYLCFLWFDNIYKENPDIKYRFCRVIFAATCSQFIFKGTPNYIDFIYSTTM